jgi:hypothetical protein
MQSDQSSMDEIEVRADEVRLGDYLLGLGVVQTRNLYRGQVTLYSEGPLWRVTVDAAHRVVVLRRG